MCLILRTFVMCLKLSEIISKLLSVSIFLGQDKLRIISVRRTFAIISLHFDRMGTASTHDENKSMKVRM